MRSLVRGAVKVVLVLAALLVGWVASAGAGLPTLPPVPPLPTVPTLPVLPPAPKPPQIPPAPVPRAPAVPSVPRPQVPAPAGTQSQGASGRSATPTGRSSSTPAKVYRLHFSRDWIARTGPKRRRQTTLVFTLRKPALVEFVVLQVAPTCRQVGRFRVQGRAGLNRVRFRGRIGRRVLGPGTYVLRARSLPGGRRLIDRRLVIVTRPDRGEIAAARGADACGSAARHSAGATARSSSATAAPSTPERAGTTPRESAKQSRPERAHGVLGARFTKKAVNAVKRIPTALWLLLGLAIALLALAALPLRAAPSRRAASLLAHQRVIFAIGGTVTLVAVTIAYLMI